jgi:endonuclease/exonuclease/phosphatase (EEP) superfamily protein YafD
MHNPTRTTAGLAALGVAVLGLTARYVPVTNHLTLFAAIMSPYLLLGALLALTLFVLCRRWIAAAAAASLMIAAAAVQSPLFIGSAASPRSASVRVMTANLSLGDADPGALVAAAREHADVVVVQELTPQAATLLTDAGMDAAFPHRALYPRDVASGIGLWSRHPVRDAGLITGFVMPFGSARLQISGVAIDPTIVVAHVTGPWPQSIEGWRADVARLPATMTDAAGRAGDGAVIVAGDFNSTVDESAFRGLLRNGYRDAAEQAGAGMTPTYPGDLWLPPLLGIDHVLTRNCSATSVRTMSLPGSDHRALVATVEIP